MKDIGMFLIVAVIIAFVLLCYFGVIDLGPLREKVTAEKPSKLADPNVNTDHLKEEMKDQTKAAQGSLDKLNELVDKELAKAR